MLAPWVLILTLHFAGPTPQKPNAEWTGDMHVTMTFTTEALCKSVRRAIWSQFQDLDGHLGDCTKVTPVGG